MASIFMALALVGGGVFLLHDIEKTSIVQEETSRAEGVLDGDWEDADNIDYAHIVSELNPKISGNTLYIDTAREFALFAHGISYNVSYTTSKRYCQLDVVLRENINLSEHWWNTAGSYLSDKEDWNYQNFNYEGTFDGMNHTIEDMNIEYFKHDEHNSSIYIGLFGYVTGTIKNLNVTGAIYIYNAKHTTDLHNTYNIGGIVGQIGYGSNASIQNCTSSVCIHYRRQGQSMAYYDLADHVNIGGVAGYSYAANTTISNCIYDGQIDFNYDKGYYNDWNEDNPPKWRFRLGGIVGYGQYSTFRECIFTGNIYVKKPQYIDQLYVGGIVALYKNSFGDTDAICDCISNGDISLAESIAEDLDIYNEDIGSYCAGAIGGIVGCAYNDSAIFYIKRCHNYSNINQNLEAFPCFHVGGILGYGDVKAHIENCSNFGKIYNRWHYWYGMWQLDGFSWHHPVPSDPSKATGTGGIVGTTTGSDVEIKYCINYGDVDGEAIGYAGGIIGHQRGGWNIVVYYCMNYGTISSKKKETTGTLFGYFTDDYGYKSHCLSFTGKKSEICGSKVNEETKTWLINQNCGIMNSPSRDDVINKKNSDGASSFWGTSPILTYHPNYDNLDLLNDKFYISPVANKSLVWHHTEAGVMVNAIIPLSLISKTVVKYYCDDDILFKQDDKYVGVSQRYLSSYVDNDEWYVTEADGDNYKYYDQLLTLRGIGVSNIEIFELNGYKMYSYSNGITGIESVWLNGVDDTTITASVSKIDSCAYRPGTITIKIKPRRQEIIIEEYDQNGEKQNKIGKITVNDSYINTMYTHTYYIEKYKYEGESNKKIKVNVVSPDNGYLVKTIVLSDGTIARNTEVSDTLEITSKSFNYCEITKIEINYAAASKKINFYYKLPSESEFTLGRDCIAGGVNDDEKLTTACLYDEIYVASGVSTLVFSGAQFKFTDTIYMYTNAGYYIKSIWANFKPLNKQIETEGLHTINGLREETEDRSMVTWQENASQLCGLSLQTFLFEQFLNEDLNDGGWCISNIYIEYGYSNFDTTTVYRDVDSTKVYINGVLCPTSENNMVCMADEMNVKVDLGYYCEIYVGKTTGRCSELYERYVSGYNGTRVNIKYDDCNPFGMIAGDFGEIASLSKHTTKAASNSTIVSFNTLSELFATFMGNFEIPTNGTEYTPTISGNTLNAYTQFYNKAIELYNSSLVSFTKNVGNDLTRSAVIGVNHPYTMAFGTDVSPELINFQTVIANLFGFSSKTGFMNYAQNLANTYAEYRTSIANSTTTNEALDNGCFYTTNGSFVFPIAVKNELPSTVLAYVILDTSGLVSVWVNDITAALRATNFNASYHTDSIINNDLYCKNILFITGPCFVLGCSTEASPHSTSLNLDENNNAQISIKLSDFVGQRVYEYSKENRIIGDNTYMLNPIDESTGDPLLSLYIKMQPTDAEVTLKIAEQNMSKRNSLMAANLDHYALVANSITEAGLSLDVYNNKIGGVTYLSDGTNLFLSTNPTSANVMFSAITMPGFVFRGLDYIFGDQETTELSQEIEEIDNRIDTLVPVTRVLAGAIYKKFGNGEIYYNQLQDLTVTVYAYYDIAQYQIQITKQINGLNVVLEGQPDPEHYFDQVSIDSSDYASDNLEFLGIYLKDGETEKLLSLDINYKLTNYNPNYIIAGAGLEFYERLNSLGKEVDEDSKATLEDYERIRIVEKHPKYILIYCGENLCYVKKIPQSNICLLVKFATKPTSSSTPPQSNQVIEVSSIDHLIWLSNQVNSGNLFENHIIKQTANIDFNGKFISPIGTENHPFKGTYDGQGYVIKNLKLIYGDTEIGTNVGLFGYTDGATIKNLTLDNCSVSCVCEVSSAKDLVWLSTQVDIGNTFENCIFKQIANIDFNGKFISPIGTEDRPFKGTYDGQGYVIKNLSLINDDTAIGTNVGLFGYTDGATIKNLTLVDGSVTGFDNVGAVVGYAKDTTLENVINQSCEVKAITYAYYDIYGDEIINGNTSGTLVDEYGFGTYSYIKYKSDRAYGGIVGRSENSTFFACGARAEIKKMLKKYNTTTAQNYSTAKGKLAYARGIIGSAESNTTLNQCYYFGDLSILNENYLTNQESLQNCIYRNGSSETPYNADTSNVNIWFEIDGKHELKIFYWS